MNPLVLTCLLCFVVCSALSAQGSEATFSGELAVVTGGPASGEGLLSALSDDEELEVDEDVSGGNNDHISLHELPGTGGKKGRRGGKGQKKNKHKRKNTTPLNPGHTSVFTNSYTSPLSTTVDPCTSTHLSYCIHGYCKHIEGLQEPVCICMKGYDGERCGIQTLPVAGINNISPDHRADTELVQMVLVVIAVVLSVISCCAILLMTCAHYRTHKNYLASYLGTPTEQEKLQKPIGDVVV